MKKFFLLFCCTILFPGLTIAQTFNGKGVIWELTKPEEPRLKLKFGTTGINIGGYEGTTLVFENVTGSDLYIDSRLTILDHCGGTKVRSVKVTVKANGKVGGSTWMGGDEQHDYSSPCQTKKTYGQNMVSKIAGVTLELVSIKDVTKRNTASGSTGGTTGGTGSGGNTSGTSGNATSNTAGSTTKGNTWGTTSGSSTNSGGNNSSGTSAGSGHSTHGTITSNCPFPNLKIEHVGEACVRLEWSRPVSEPGKIVTHVEGASQTLPDKYYLNYLVSYRKSGDRDWITIKARREGLVMQPFRIGALDPCTNFEVKVQTDCGNGSISPPSSTLQFTTKCLAPSPLTIENISTQSATVTGQRQLISSFPCDAPKTRVKVVEYKAPGGPWEDLICNTGQPCILNALNKATPYRVRARFKYGPNLFSEYTNEVSFTTK